MILQRKFKTVLFGYHKSDVNAYIERLLDDFDERLKEKEEEINQYKNQYKEYKHKYEDTIRTFAETQETGVMIEDIPYRSNERMDQILKDTKGNPDDQLLGQPLSPKETETWKQMMKELQLIQQISKDIEMKLKKHDSISKR